MLPDLVITGFVGGFPERKEAWIGVVALWLRSGSGAASERSAVVACP
jgi:hypothetical protein